MKGNRQIAEKNVNASRKFVDGPHTYIIKEKSIFYKKISGSLSPISIYTEDNPNPHDFKDKNTGLSKQELNELYEGDFYTILVDAQRENKIMLMVVIVIINLVLSLLYFSSVMLGALMR